MPSVVRSVQSPGAARQVHGRKNKTQTNDWEVLNAFRQVESVPPLRCINGAVWRWCWGMFSQMFKLQQNFPCSLTWRALAVGSTCWS